MLSEEFDVARFSAGLAAMALYDDYDLREDLLEAMWAADRWDEATLRSAAGQIAATLRGIDPEFGPHRFEDLESNVVSAAWFLLGEQVRESDER